MTAFMLRSCGILRKGYYEELVHLYTFLLVLESIFCSLDFLIVQIESDFQHSRGRFLRIIVAFNSWYSWIPFQDSWKMWILLRQFSEAWCIFMSAWMVFAEWLYQCGCILQSINLRAQRSTWIHSALLRLVLFFVMSSHSWKRSELLSIYYWYCLKFESLRALITKPVNATASVLPYLGG